MNPGGNAVPMVPHGENIATSKFEANESAVDFLDHLKAAGNAFRVLSETDRRNRGPEFWAAAMKLRDELAPFAEGNGVQQSVRTTPGNHHREVTPEISEPYEGDEIVPEQPVSTSEAANGEVDNPIFDAEVPGSHFGKSDLPADETEIVSLEPQKVGDETVPLDSLEITENKTSGENSESEPAVTGDAVSIRDADELILRVAGKWATDGTLDHLPRKIDLVDMIWNAPAKGIRESLGAMDSGIVANRWQAIAHLREIIPDVAVWLASRNLQNEPFAA